MLESLLMMEGCDQSDSLLQLFNYFEKGTKILQSLCFSGSISEDEKVFLDRAIGHGRIDSLAGFIKQSLKNEKYLILGRTEDLFSLDFKDLRSELLKDNVSPLVSFVSAIEPAGKLFCCVEKDGGNILAPVCLINAPDCCLVRVNSEKSVNIVQNKRQRIAVDEEGRGDAEKVVKRNRTKK